MKIGELAKATRLPTKTIRFYEAEGLIPDPPRTGSGYVYEPDSDNTYRLCANFSKPSFNSAPNDFWAHELGYQCFSFTLVSRVKLE